MSIACIDAVAAGGLVDGPGARSDPHNERRCPAPHADDAEDKNGQAAAAVVVRHHAGGAPEEGALNLYIGIVTLSHNFSCTHICIYSKGHTRGL